MPSINQVHLMGHLGREPEIRYSANGKPVANFSLATSSKNKDGNETTEWHRCVCFGVMAEQMKNATKGALVDVVGRIQTRKWTDREGNDRYTTEVVGNLVVRCSWDKQDAPNAAPVRSQSEPDDEIPF